MNIKDLGYARAIAVPRDNSVCEDTLLIAQPGVDWLNDLANGTSAVHSNTSFFGWLPGTLGEYDDHTPDQVENDIETVDEVMATRSDLLVHIVIHPDFVRRECFDLGWHEFVKPVPKPKPGNLETGEPFTVGEAIELEDMKDLNFRFYKLLDNQGDLVALVQVDEGDEEQEKILQFLADAPKMRRTLMDDLQTVAG